MFWCLTRIVPLRVTNVGIRSAEVFPLSHRELGMGFAVATCLFWAAALGITLPLLLARVGTVGVFGIYAGFNFVAWIMIFFWVPGESQSINPVHT